MNSFEIFYLEQIVLSIIRIKLFQQNPYENTSMKENNFN